jgi:hypothetical protein
MTICRKKKTDKEKILELERKQYKHDPRKGSDVWKLKDPTKVYFFDAKGDQNNLVFGALYRLDIPSYFKSRNVLGTTILSLHNLTNCKV